MAQWLDSVLDWRSKGRRFKSWQEHKKNSRVKKVVLTRCRCAQPVCVYAHISIGIKNGHIRYPSYGGMQKKEKKKKKLAGKTRRLSITMADKKNHGLETQAGHCVQLGRMSMSAEQQLSLAKIATTAMMTVHDIMIPPSLRCLPLSLCEAPS